eukprot:Rmarinus@m.12259
MMPPKVKRLKSRIAGLVTRMKHQGLPPPNHRKPIAVRLLRVLSKGLQQAVRAPPPRQRVQRTGSCAARGSLDMEPHRIPLAPEEAREEVREVAREVAEVLDSLRSAALVLQGEERVPFPHLAFLTFRQRTMSIVARKAITSPQEITRGTETAVPRCTLRTTRKLQARAVT